MDKDQILALVEARIDVPGLVQDVLVQILKPALDEMVADSSNPYDDMAVAALYPVLEPALLKEVQKLWDKVDGVEG